MEERTVTDPLIMQEIAYGILVIGADPDSSIPKPQYIYGQINIEGNYVDLEQDGVPSTWPDPPAVPYDPSDQDWIDWFNETWSTRSMLVGWTEADIEVRGNHVYNDTFSGIFLFDNDGIMMAEDNVVELGPSNSHLIGGTAVGMQAWNSLPDSAPKGNAHFLKNTVVCNGADQVGMILGNYQPAVLGTSSARKNHITLNMDSQVGISLGGLDNSYIGQNKIDGIGLVGLVLGSDEVGCELFSDAENNVVVGNNISNLESMWNVVLTCSINNVIVGGEGTLFNIGIGNKIRGDYIITGSPGDPGGVGQQISEALGNMHGSIGMSEGIPLTLSVIPE
jgi:hypothetical protein